jgi:hypothetical protein
LAKLILLRKKLAKSISMGFKNPPLILIFFGKIEKNRSQTTPYLYCLFALEKTRRISRPLRRWKDTEKNKIKDRVPNANAL